MHCFDSQPDQIVAREMGRDARLFSDDNIQILLDTFHDGRNAYYFQTNPLGALVDGRIAENSRPDSNWDGIWSVQARGVDDGWTAEFAIPFKTLSFQTSIDSWGFNAERSLARNRERSRWATPSLNVRFNQVSVAGSIGGLDRLSQGVGLDIKPYGLVGFAQDATTDQGTTLNRDAGLDVFYRLTSNLISATTINTDFAETEVDTRQVNLTRFSRFFPEKRAFFLEGAGIFDFGVTPGGGGGGRGPRPDLVPFFSRRIGLVNGAPAPIVIGEKVTGKVGRFDVGVLNVLTGDVDEVEGQNLFVARTKANFWSQSYVGGLVTLGDPTGESTNNLAGVDMKLATSNFMGNRQVSLSLYGSKTQTPELVGDDMAYGFQFDYPNDFIRASTEMQVIGKNYNPELGFVLRDGVRKTQAQFGVRPRPERWGIRQVQFEAQIEQYYDLVQEEVATRQVDFDIFQFEFEDGQRLNYRVRSQMENLFQPFEIYEGVTIPTGEYSYWEQRFRYRSRPTTPWQIDMDYTFGSFYSGSSRRLSTELSWANSRISTSAELQQYWVSLAEGSFRTRLALMRLDYSFSPLTTVSNFVQYDTESQNIGLQSRLRWIIRPGNEIFFVVNHAWQRDIFDRFESLNSDVRAKMNYTFRF